jgi:hypothetical protein
MIYLQLPINNHFHILRSVNFWEQCNNKKGEKTLIQFMKNKKKMKEEKYI